MIPTCDLPDFARLPTAIRDEVVIWDEICAEIGAASAVRLAVREASSQLEGRPIGGTSVNSILRRFYAWKATGWRALVDARRVPAWSAEKRGWTAVMGSCNPANPSERSALSTDVVNNWRSLCDENHRKTKPAYRKLVRQWRAGMNIPGIGTWQEWFLRTNPENPLPAECPPDLPVGLSYRNLLRYRPDGVDRAITKVGIAAARLELPSVIGTREGIRFLEWIVMDDWRSDFRVIAGGRAAELSGILALDVGSAMALRFGLRPAVRRPDGTDEGLRKRDTKEIVALILSKYGYPLDYVCNIIVERGTATIAPDDAEAIEEITSGHVRIHYTSMISGSVFGFADRPVGNYLGKAWLESYFNLVHNEMADQPGQIGARYSLAPAATEAKQREVTALVAAGKFLAPEVRREIRMPFLSLDEATVSFEHMFRRLNQRHDHQLEGFADRAEWREARLDQWRPAAESVGLSELAHVGLQWRTRKETPLERSDKLRAGVRFQRIHPSCLPRILDEHRTVTVGKPGEIAFDVAGKRRVWRDPDNQALRTGSEFLAYYAGADPEWIHLTNGAGGYVGSLKEVKGVHRGDHVALAIAIAQKQAMLNARIAQVRGRNTAALDRRLADIEQNTALLNRVDVSLLADSDGGPGTSPAMIQHMDTVSAVRADRAARDEALAATEISADDLARAQTRDDVQTAGEQFSAEEISALLEREE